MAYEGLDRKHECQRQDTFENIARTLGRIEGKIDTLENSVSNLFTKNDEKSKEISEFKVATTKETTILSGKFGIVSNLIALFTAVIALIVSIFWKGK